MTTLKVKPSCLVLPKLQLYEVDKNVNLCRHTSSVALS